MDRATPSVRLSPTGDDLKRMTMEQQDNARVWEDRAKVFKEDKEATFPDVYLREREIDRIAEYIGKFANERVLDAGCGNGYSTVKFSERYPRSAFVGVDITAGMIEHARNRNSKVAFDLMDLKSLEFEPALFNVVTTCRVLINLSSFDAQVQAVRELHRVLVPNGVYIMLESTLQSYANLNRMRAKYGLPHLVPNAANLYIDSDRLLNKIEDLFRLVEVDSFSSAYYLGSRVAYPLVAGSPGPLVHDHPVNRLFAEFEPGGDYGREKIFVLEKR